VFLQDDWRLKSTLSLNLGIRFEQDLAQTERYNRMVNGFDATTPNRIAPAVQAAYAANYAAIKKRARALRVPAPHRLARLRSTAV